MLKKLWAFFFGGEVEQQVVVVNAATLQDAYEFRRRLYADIGDEVSPGVMEKFKVAVAREANWKVYVVMALIAAGKVPDVAAAVTAAAENQ